MNPDETYFTADTHFGHRAVIDGMCKRPFANVDEMDEWLIAKWNETVPRDGDVWHIGDVSFRRNADTFAILKRLNGRLHLVKGNHDKGLNASVLSRFHTVQMRAEIRLNGQKIVMHHEPIHSWAGVAHGAWHLHGHSHGTSEPLGRRFDVGMDCNSLRPVSYRELQPIMALRPIESGDGHTCERRTK